MGFWQKISTPFSFGRFKAEKQFVLPSEVDDADVEDGAIRWNAVEKRIEVGSDGVWGTIGGGTEITLSQNQLYGREDAGTGAGEGITLDGSLSLASGTLKVTPPVSSPANALRQNNTLYNVLDANTGEAVTYKKVTTWLDGSAMDDDRIDSVWFVKVGSEYFERVWPNGIINMKAYGCVADGSTDNHAIVQGLIDYIPVNYSVVLFFPAAKNKYYFSDTITIMDKPIHVLGVNKQTQFLFPAAKTGIHITRVSGYDFYRLEHLTLFASGKAADATYDYCGVKIEGVSRLYNIDVRNFSGYGILLIGTMAGTGTNVSGSWVENPAVSQCGRGIGCIGDDGNGVQIVNPDIRDIDNIGIYDNTLIGMNVFGGILHYAGGGYYYQNYVNATSAFYGTYFEGGNPASTVNGSLIVDNMIGGTTFNGSKINVRTGRSSSSLFAANDANDSRVGIRVNSSTGQAELALQGAADQGLRLRNLRGHNYHDANWQWEWYGDPSKPIGGFLAPATYYNYHGIQRITRHPLTSTETRIESGVLVQWADSLDDIIQSPYRVGDIVKRRDYDGSGIRAWVCIEAGSVFNIESSPGVSLIQGTSAGGTTLQLTGAPADLRNLGEGDVISIGGNVRTIVSKSAEYVWTVEVDSALPVISTPTDIFVEAPVWKALGPSVGTTAQRPTLGANDAGFEHYNTDTKSKEYWTGTAWLASGAVYNKVSTATDADYTVTASDYIIMLPEITADRSITLPSAASSAGRSLLFYNGEPAAGDDWVFSIAVKHYGDSTGVLQVVPPLASIEIFSDGTNWICKYYNH